MLWPVTLVLLSLLLLCAQVETQAKETILQYVPQDMAAKLAQ